jgi:hypothetical protein
MGLPFSVEQFLRVFAEYNRAVWPAQPVLYLVALTGLIFAAGRRARSGRVVSIILAALWLWAGVVYHLAFFAPVNRAAYAFGALFVLQSLLFAEAGLRKTPLTFHFRADARGLVGLALFAYSLLVYPALGHLLGHQYPAAPTFGVPCPVAIYTFAVLLWAESRVPARLLPIPVAWALVGVTAAFGLGMTEDFGLTAGAALALILIAARNRKLRVRSNVVEVAR